MFTFDIQLFADYNVNDLATVGQIKTLATRIATRLAALETPKAFKGARIIDNKLCFYESADTTKTAIASIDLPEELYVQGLQTEIVEDFEFSAETYPGATNPNLNGKTVLVLAARGDGADGNGTPTVKYSFVNMSTIFDEIIPKVSGATEGNVPVFSSDGTITNSTIVGGDVVVKVAGATENHIMIFNAQGKPKDGGHGIATDAQFEAMLDEVLPTVQGGGA